MKTDDKLYYDYLQILKEELVPAMGCTEPISLAYGAATARDILGDIPQRVEVFASANIIKNVKSVVVPNTGNLKGIEAAVSAGIIAGDARKKLEVISEVTKDQEKEIREFLKNSQITVQSIDSDEVFDIFLIMYKDDISVKLRIVKYHTNIVLIEKNGKPFPTYNAFKYDLEKESQSTHVDRSILSIKKILDFSNNVKIEDVKSVLDLQIQYNKSVSEEGINNNYGANIGSTWLEYNDDNIRNRIIAMAAAGSDARMSGCELPVIINSGSGNQGITVSVPVIVYAEYIRASKEKTYRALTLSNLIAIHEKTGIGCLSAYCGAVSAGCAAACGIAYLDGGGYTEIAHTLVNSIAITSGIVCDGAKPSCAGKIAMSVSAGLLGYDMYRNGGQEFKSGEGIVDCGVEETIVNVGRLGKDGMRATDKEIVRIMIGNETIDIPPDC